MERLLEGLVFTVKRTAQQMPGRDRARARRHWNIITRHHELRNPMLRAHRQQ
jgi:hypothetical protein